MILQYLKNLIDPYSEWLDHPCEHAASKETHNMSLSTFTRPIDDGPLFNGTARDRKFAVPSNYEWLTGNAEADLKTVDVDIEEHEASTQYTYRMCPTWRCPECGEIFRGPWYEVDTQIVWKGEEQPKRAKPIGWCRR